MAPKSKVVYITFNNEVPQEKVDELVDRICDLLQELDITAVQRVGIQEVCDEQA